MAMMNTANTIREIEKFSDLLIKQTIRKEKAYDGSSRELPIDTCFRYSAEELGEVSTAISRDRYTEAEWECLDLAHCAFLLWLSIRRKIQSDIDDEEEDG